MESEFARAIIPVMVIGLAIVAAGTLLLYRAFRVMGEGRAAERTHLRLTMALILFLFVCCAIFYVLSLK